MIRGEIPLTHKSVTYQSGVNENLPLEEMSILLLLSFIISTWVPKVWAEKAESTCRCATDNVNFL
jgi:hypothetical protein